MLGPLEQGQRLPLLADRVVGDHALACLGGGDPRAVGHAAHAEAFHDERVPSLVEPGAGLVAGQHAGQHRVVPVHRPAVLGGEVLGAAGDDVAQAGGRELPVGALVSELLGDGDGAAQ